MKHKWLWGIIVIASITRLIGLSTHPVGFTPDEASFGYDAYSILKTGRDQWGNWLPITLKSFGDYKMPLYTYFSIPSIFLFGLNIFATRLPNAILGVLAVLATYLFVNKLFKNEKIALISSLLLAISPWHIALSRGAFEANLTTFFLTIGLYFLLKGKENSKNFAVSFLFLGLNLFTYHTARILTLPTIFLALILLFDSPNKIYKQSRKYLGVLIIFVILAGFSLFSGGGQRLATSNIFSLSENVFIDRVSYINAGMPELLAKMTHNKPFYVTNIFISKYLEYFSPQFLFTQGAREATYGMIPGVGVLYLFEVFTLLSAIIYLVKNIDRKFVFLILWILISAGPAALSLGPGLAANRVAFMIPALQIISAIGLLEIYKFAKKYVDAKFILAGCSLVIFVSFLKFIELQWFVQPVRGAKEMIVGTEEIFTEVSRIEEQYTQIIVDKKISEAHAFVAFYNKYDPNLYKLESEAWVFDALGYSWVDQMPEYNLGKYVFRDIDWQRDLRQPNSLIIFRAGYLPEIATPIKTYYYPDKTPAYYLIDTRTNIFAKI